MPSERSNGDASYGDEGGDSSPLSKAKHSSGINGADREGMEEGKPSASVIVVVTSSSSSSSLSDRDCVTIEGNMEEDGDLGLIHIAQKKQKRRDESGGL